MANREAKRKATQKPPASDYKDSNRPRPTAAIDEDETPLLFLLRQFKEGKLIYKDGEIYSLFDNRGKGSWRDKAFKVGNVNNRGYVRYSFRFNGRYHAESVHRIVYVYFNDISIFERGYEINHIDGNQLNNKIENLELVTSSENKLHALRTGLRKIENTNTAKLDWVKVAEIKNLFHTKTHKQIAEIYGVHKSTIDSISQNKAWVEGGRSIDKKKTS
jgi:acetolactate synthase regulatory subunit